MAADQIGGDVGTILGDFTHVMGDGPVGVHPASGNIVAFQRTFDTGGIRTDQSIVLMFAVSGKGGTPADVLINSVQVGNINSAPADSFSTQIITIAKDSHQSKAFKNTHNVFDIMNVADDFQIKSIVCFFHQES
jgi:hypothetical protein